jgi:hypothetical protein
VKQRYVEGGMRLRSFRIERNGNGRDFDIIPEFSGSYGHAYSLAFEIVDSNASVALHRSGYFVDPSSPLRIFVRQSDIRQTFPTFTLGRPYRVRATSVLDVGNGGLSSHWSDAFIDRVFPLRERSVDHTRDNLLAWRRDVVLRDAGRIDPTTGHDRLIGTLVGVADRFCPNAWRRRSRAP